jgi:hypothetical protein
MTPGDMLEIPSLPSAAAIMRLIQSAKLNGHDPYRYLKDVLERLPTQSVSRLEVLLPHRWREICVDTHES